MKKMFHTCFLDLDGVLVDFHLAVLNTFEVSKETFDAIPRPLPWDWVWTATGVSEEAFWERLVPDWWENLPWTPEGKDILFLLEKYFGHENICLLTDHSARDYVIKGKQAWLKKELPKYFPSQVLFGRAKHFCAGPGHLLIDDGTHNCENFEDQLLAKHGLTGHIHLYARPWNKNHAVPDPLQHLREFLIESINNDGGGVPRRAV